MRKVTLKTTWREHLPISRLLKSKYLAKTCLPTRGRNEIEALSLNLSIRPFMWENQTQPHDTCTCLFLPIMPYYFINLAMWTLVLFHSELFVCCGLDVIQCCGGLVPPQWLYLELSKIWVTNNKSVTLGESLRLHSTQEEGFRHALYTLVILLCHSE